VSFDRRFIFDVAVNIAIYVPLGMSGYLAFRRLTSTALCVTAPIVSGAVLSASMEMLQLFTPHRQCSTVDLFNNILGSAIGVILGIAFTQVVDIPARLAIRDRSSLGLLICWVSFLLFPFFPVLTASLWMAKLSAFIHPPLMDPIPFLLSAAEWFAVGRLVLAAGVRSPVRWFAALLLFLPIQFGILNRNPRTSEWEGASVALLLFFFFRNDRKADLFAGTALLIALTLRGLAPFRFEGPPQSFLWIPFGGFLGIEWQNAMVILLGKLFQYGTSIWLLDRALHGIVRATAIVTMVLAVIVILQTRIPGHVAELTDPLLALALGVTFIALSREGGSLNQNQTALRAR